jgi:hypothetical protein
MTIYEQADRTGETVRYSWMVSRGYATRGEMDRLGWKWISGRPRGCFVTNDPVAVSAFRRAMAALTAEQTAPSIVSNGTHDRANAPMRFA